MKAELIREVQAAKPPARKWELLATKFDLPHLATANRQTRHQSVKGRRRLKPTNPGHFAKMGS